MAEYTQNLSLKKPDKTEQYNIADFNDNFDKIDNFAGLTPPRALTADKFTTGVNINDVFFDGTQDIEIETGGGLEVGDIGIAVLLIDETKGKRRYLNGSILSINSNTQEFVNKLKSTINLYPSLACTEQEWQATATMTVGGQVGKFVVDDDTGTIRLPKIIMPIQGLTDLSKLAEIVEAGLPDHKHSYTFKNQPGGDNSGGDNNSIGNATFQTGLASESNPIYGNSNTVQQEQIQYPYFIQVATGVEEEVNITNTFETNIPYTLLDSVYSEYPKYNASMLLSAGQENPKGTYPDVYDALLIEQNSDIAIGTTVTLTSGTSYTKRGLSVKNSTDADITDFDFVVNTANETFKLALKTKLASGSAVAGNGMNLGLTDGSGNYGLRASGGQGECLTTASSLYGQNVGSSSSDTGVILSSLGITIDPTKSGIETSDSGLYLYFYVGTTTQNDNIVNLGRVEEQIANINALPHIVETYQSGTSWYRVWSPDSTGKKWCEQGGTMSASTFGTSVAQVTLLKAYRDINYIVIGSKTVPDASAVGLNCPIDKTTTTFTWSVAYTTSLTREINWEAKGYIE